MSFCLQPSRRPSLQPTFSLDCLSASPHHHQNQRFASQLSLCLGNPQPSSLCTSSHLPTPPLYSSSRLQFPHHYCSSSSALQTPTYYNCSFSQYNPTVKSTSKTPPSLSPQSQTNSCSPPHTNSETLCNGSCAHKTTPASSSHLLYLSNKPYSHCLVSTLPNRQVKSNSNPKTLQSSSFHSGCQINPRTPLQPDPNPQTQHPAVQPWRSLPAVSSTPHTHPYTEYKAAVCSVPITNPLLDSQMPNLPVTTQTTSPVTCSKRPASRPVKAGGLLPSCLH